MQWKMLPSNTQRMGKRLVRPFPVFLSLGLCLLPAGAAPFVEMKFQQNSSTSLINTGTAGTSATLSSPNPTFSPNTPFGGGAYAVDITSSGGPSAVDLLTGEVLNAAKDLKSFSILGWVNCRSATVSAGGNRIVSWYQPLNSGDGVDLAMNSSGALSLGIKSWNDWGGVTSNGGKVTVDASTAYNNWRFFAVTYDATLSSGQVKFYFGTSTSPAELDRSATYAKGLTGSTIAPSLTLGNHSTATRTSTNHAGFRGLMDEIRVFGSKTNGEGALSLSVIQTLQAAAPLAGQPGLLYERWNNITGTTIASLTSNSRFPNTPDQTLVRTTFEGFVNAGDNFGIKMSGWIEAPVTGNYVFGLTSDDAGELRLSSNSNPVNKLLILSNPTWTSINTWAQQTAPIPLEAGKFYYIEALMKDGTGGDHLKVGWKRPSDTEIQVIGAPALFVTPPQIDALYPSAYHLYEPGTGTRKATMGWQKEEGNSHFYIEAEGHRSLKVQNGSVVVPDRLFFGGEYPNYPIDVTKGDLGFKYERDVESTVGTLTLENQAGEWALRAFSSVGEVQPQVQFNHSISILGTPFVEASGAVWNGSASIHHVQGAMFQRSMELPNPGDYYSQSSAYHGGGITMLREWNQSGFLLAETTSVIAGTVTVKAKNPYGTSSGTASLSPFSLGFELVDGGVVQNSSSMDAGTLTIDNVYATAVHADSFYAAVVVTTPKWRVASTIPDYVFDEKYKLRSLEETERFVREKKHLPEIPSAKEMSAKGIDLADMNIKLLKKVEELTLHMIARDKELKTQRRDNRQMKQEMRSLRGAGKGN